MEINEITTECKTVGERSSHGTSHMRPCCISFRSTGEWGKKSHSRDTVKGVYTLGNTYRIGIDVCVGVTTLRVGGPRQGFVRPFFAWGVRSWVILVLSFVSLSLTLFLSVSLKLATILVGCLYGKGRAARRVQLYRTRTEKLRD